MGARPEPDPAGPDVNAPAVGVDEQERRLRRHDDAGPSVEDQHPDRHVCDVPERRVRVVMGEDLAIVPTVACVALGAPLAHADAVPGTAAADDHELGGLRNGRAGEAAREHGEDG